MYIPDFFTQPHKISGMPEDTPILVALSGGADSTALLHLLISYAKDAGCKIYAAHVNHNIRNEEYGGEALRDELFCRELCRELGVELYVYSVDVPRLAKDSKKSLELKAREVRYAFFSQIMKEHGIKLLATAHNADDNLETQIYNLCRGCGVDGICGIPPRRHCPDVNGGLIIRPILRASKQEILSLCGQNGWKYVTDSTNMEQDCTRNKIRHKVVPTLRELFGEPTRSGTRLSECASEDCDFILSEAEKVILRHNTAEGFPLSELKDLHPALKKRVIISLCHSSLEKVHIDALLSLCDGGVPLSSLSLPDGICGYISRDGSLLSFGKSVPRRGKYSFYVKPQAGFQKIPDTSLAILLDDSGKASLPDSVENCCLYTSALLYGISISELIVRSRQEGDKICDGGMNKKVKKLICDKKIPLEIRDSLPILTDASGEILYIPGCAVCDRAKPRNNTEKNNFVAIGIYKF